MLKLFLEKLNRIILNRNELSVVSARFIYAGFCIVALIMSIVNIVTKQQILLTFTASFSVLCALNFVISFLSEKGQRIASDLFIVEILILFSYFVVTGGTDKFSIIWLLLLPTLGIPFFGFKKGTLHSVAMLLICLACFNIPTLRNLCVDYGNTFRLRFPLVFISSYAISFILEYIHYITSNELEKAREKYEHLYSHDQLTGLFNRYEMEKSAKDMENQDEGTIALLSFDIDFFKEINDTYGHLAGDYALKTLGDIILSTIPEGAKAFRTGGEEFSVIYMNSENAEENAEILRKKVEKYKYSYEGVPLHFTISLGLLIIPMAAEFKPSFDEALVAADKLLYEAKKNGRNRLVCSVYQTT